MLKDCGLVNQEQDFVSLYEEMFASLPLKMMEHAVPFIVGCLNSRRKGTIRFGVMNNSERVPQHVHTYGKVVGITMYGNVSKLIHACFSNVLDYHIETDTSRSLNSAQKDCMKLHLIKVTSRSFTQPHDPSTNADVPLSSKRSLEYVVEIDVQPEWEACRDHVFYFWWFSRTDAGLCTLDQRDPKVYQSLHSFRENRANKQLVIRQAGKTRHLELQQGTTKKKELCQRYQIYVDEMQSSTLSTSMSKQ